MPCRDRIAYVTNRSTNQQEAIVTRSQTILVVSRSAGVAHCRQLQPPRSWAASRRAAGDLSLPGPWQVQVGSRSEAATGTSHASSRSRTIASAVKAPATSSSPTRRSRCVHAVGNHRPRCRISRIPSRSPAAIDVKSADGPHARHLCRQRRRLEDRSERPAKGRPRDFGGNRAAWCSFSGDSRASRCL